MPPLGKSLNLGFYLTEDFAYGQISSRSILRLRRTHTIEINVHCGVRTGASKKDKRQFFLFLSRTNLPSLQLT
jgi:hypothetical protein